MPDHGRLFFTARINPSGGLVDQRVAEAPRRGSEVLDTQFFIERARAARVGGFAAVFLADQARLALDETHLPESTIDPIVLATLITSQVDDIGVIVTASANFNLPYQVARAFASVQLASEGRVGWNAVATLNDGVAANYGGRIVEAEQRYERAAEFVGVVRALFESWHYPWSGDEPSWGQHDPIDWEGEHFRVRGPLNVPLSPWGAPVQVQAGGSPQGVRLAGRFAELVYGIAHTKEYAADYRASLRESAISHGRGADDIRFAPLVTPVPVSSAEERARVAAGLIEDAVTLPHRVAALERQLNRHLSQLELDEPISLQGLEPIDTSNRSPEGATRSLHQLVEAGPATLRTLLTASDRLLIDTPEALAGKFFEWWRDGAADGFTVNTLIDTNNLSDVAEQVVPILRRTGAVAPEYLTGGLRANLGSTEGQEATWRR